MNKINTRIKTFALQALKQISPSAQNKLIAHTLNRRYSGAGLVFVHIPKAAGISISRALYGAGVGHYSVNYLVNNLSKAALNLPFFTVVRDPYERLKSAYEFTLHGGTAGFVSNSSAYAEHMSRGFDQFVCDWLVKQNIEALDFVFQPQMRFLQGNETDQLHNELQHIGKLEQLHETESWISSQLGEPFKMDVLNKSNRKNDSQIRSNETENIVKEIYALDYSVLGY